MIKLVIFIMVIVALGGCMLIAQQMKQTAATKALYLGGLGSALFSWALLFVNFTFFITGWHQYIAHEVVKQAPNANASIRILAPLFHKIFTFGPAFFMGLVCTLVGVVVGVICIVSQKDRPIMPFFVALANVGFLLFTEQVFDQFITYLPYTIDRVVGTLVILLAYAAALCVQTAIAVFRAPTFHWIDEDEVEEAFYEEYQFRPKPAFYTKLAKLENEAQPIAATVASK